MGKIEIIFLIIINLGLLYLYADFISWLTMRKIAKNIRIKHTLEIKD